MKLISTEKQKPAREPVAISSRGVRVVLVEYIGKQDVYNLEVDDHHNFSVNDGLIVHNCCDALRYSYETLRLTFRPTVVSLQANAELARPSGNVL